MLQFRFEPLGKPFEESGDIAEQQTVLVSMAAKVKDGKFATVALQYCVHMFPFKAGICVKVERRICTTLQDDIAMRIGFFGQIREVVMGISIRYIDNGFGVHKAVFEKRGVGRPALRRKRRFVARDPIWEEWVELQKTPLPGR